MRSASLQPLSSSSFLRRGAGLDERPCLAGWRHNLEGRQMGDGAKMSNPSDSFPSSSGLYLAWQQQTTTTQHKTKEEGLRHALTLHAAAMAVGGTLLPPWHNVMSPLPSSHFLCKHVSRTHDPQTRTCSDTKHRQVSWLEKDFPWSRFLISAHMSTSAGVGGKKAWLDGRKENFRIRPSGKKF